MIVRCARELVTSFSKLYKLRQSTVCHTDNEPAMDLPAPIFALPSQRTRVQTSFSNRACPKIIWRFVLGSLSRTIQRTFCVLHQSKWSGRFDVLRSITGCKLARAEGFHLLILFDLLEHVEILWPLKTETWGESEPTRSLFILLRILGKTTEKAVLNEWACITSSQSVRLIFNPQQCTWKLP